MKTCTKCGKSLSLDCFYDHPKGRDGLYSKCKECVKQDVRENRARKAEYYRAYDRKRGSRQTPEYQRDYRKRYPKKASARRKVAYEIGKGTLIPEPCEECGAEPTHAHHDDYEKKLNIRWLCALCHQAWHKENGEGANAG